MCSMCRAAPKHQDTWRAKLWVALFGPLLYSALVVYSDQKPHNQNTHGKQTETCFYLFFLNKNTPGSLQEPQTNCPKPLPQSFGPKSAGGGFGGRFGERTSRSRREEELELLKLLLCHWEAEPLEPENGATCGWGNRQNQA